jgi:hypothetical protein
MWFEACQSRHGLMADMSVIGSAACRHIFTGAAHKLQNSRAGFEIHQQRSQS